ncbi:acylphosphatase [archaeon]|jgi:acylphosphatase|nr:acylphosphatase [archaeon]MBT3577635.1 acylphosphatase [archaeon]MBT6819899.1 acylphosphatase [archaeon]MBT6956691.1 acylphosphatase [archaeon]MBT7025055.1 acylphosphatase [archaeon]
MKKAARIIIQGTVQGIFYRQFVKESADKLGVTGFVRNLENGDVEIIAEGVGDGIDELSKICNKGPEHAMIKNVIVEERRWSGEFKDFKVLRI